MLDTQFQKIILKSTGAISIKDVNVIQELWSGYGQILRYSLKGSSIPSVVVKHVKLPDKRKHPLGWNTDISNKRKLKSYKVEMTWYGKWAEQCNEKCYIPKCFALEKIGDEILMVMEDLDTSGFSERRNYVSWSDIKSCLKWLANFHAVFMGYTPEELWKIGTYWHLDTRPDELKILEDINLKNSAGLIDQKLKNVKYKTFVHGDAKLENFCFTKDGLKVAAIDFQYVGGGCGMKDIAYFMDSCLSEKECEKMESDILDYYFSELRNALTENNKDVNSIELENEWRSMYHIAWADFYRFLKGWSSGNLNLNSYGEKITKEVIKNLKN